MKKYTFTAIALFIAAICLGQDEDKVKVGISGFVSTKMFYDSREVVTSRDGEILFYPMPKKLDANGNDINDNSSFNFTSIHSRLRVKTTPLTLWGGSLTSHIEADFLGNGQDNIGQLRIRHAYVNYAKDKWSLIVGQYWHPMFQSYCYPTTSLITLGTPGDVLSRNPQLRFTYQFNDKLKTSFTALSQLNFKSDGPKGASSEYITKSGMPELNLSIESVLCPNWTLGAIVGTKTLVPRTVNDDNNKVDESISTFHVAAYSTLKTPKMSYKLKAIYTEDGYNLKLLGGYAVSKINADNSFDYTPIRSFSTWGEMISHYSSAVNFGVFAAYAKNLGAPEEVLPQEGVFARGADIEKLFKVSPRVIFGQKSFKIMAEITQIFADYGTTNAKMQVKDTDRIGSTRFQLHVLYNF